MAIDYASDEALQGIHDEMYQREEQRPKSGFARMSKKTKMWIGIIGGGIALMWWMKKISNDQALLFLAIGALILFLLSHEPERTELTWIECMIRVNDLLKFLQNHPIGDIPQVPKGDITVTPIGRKQWFEGQSFKRSFGVKIYDRDVDVWEWYFVEVDIYTGDIITFQAKPEGVYGDETKDITLMPSYDMFLGKKRDQYLMRSKR